jgi:hypothetical protein
MTQCLVKHKDNFTLTHIRHVLLYVPLITAASWRMEVHSLVDML